jgi:hypothetical protein
MLTFKAHLLGNSVAPWEIAHKEDPRGAQPTGWETQPLSYFAIRLPPDLGWQLGAHCLYPGVICVSAQYCSPVWSKVLIQAYEGEIHGVTNGVQRGFALGNEPIFRHVRRD